MRSDQVFVNNPARRLLTSRVGNELILLDEDSGQYFRLNEVATDAMDGLCDGEPLAAVQARLVSNYACAEDQAWADLVSLVTSLCAAGILVPRS